MKLTSTFLNIVQINTAWLLFPRTIEIRSVFKYLQEKTLTVLFIIYLHTIPIIKIPHNYEVNLFTDRAIYRPGQTIYFCGIAWEANKENSKAIAGKEYTVTFHDANNQEIASKRFTSNEFGSFAGNFTIPKDILNGHVSIRTDGARHFVSVAEYQRPKFEITFDPVTGSYQSGDTITVKGKAKTYSGVSLSDCQVSYTLSKNNFYRFNPKRFISHGEVMTDRNGNFQIRFATDTTTQDTPYTGIYNTYYTVSVTITSPNGETQTKEFTLRIDKTPYQLSIQLPTRWNKHNPLDVEITAVNANGNPLAQTVNYSIAQLKPLSNLKESYSINNVIIEKEILQGVYKTGNNPLHIDLSIYPSGAYLFTAEGSTSNGQKIRRQRIFYLYAPSDKRPPILTYNWLIEEKTTCKPGEEAKITLGSSASDVYVLYEIYDRGQFIQRKRFELTDENITLSVPYKADYGKSIQLLITYVKDRQLFYNAITIKRQEPDKQLDIFTESFRDHLSPGPKRGVEFYGSQQGGRTRVRRIYGRNVRCILRSIRLEQMVFQSCAPVPRNNTAMGRQHSFVQHIQIYRFQIKKLQDPRIQIRPAEPFRVEIQSAHRRSRIRCRPGSQNGHAGCRIGREQCYRI